MVLINFGLGFLFVINVFIRPATCLFPLNSQDLDLDDIITVGHEFPSLINKMKTMLNRLHCPRGWKYLGGSCYSLSDVPSASTEANETCNLLHSNNSNLMQIRNTVELFYAARVLIENNLSELIIEIDRDFFKEKNIGDISMGNLDRWQRLIEYFRRDLDKYHRLNKNLRDALKSVGVRIVRRSKKVGQNANYNDSEQMENIRGVCDQIDWNTTDTNATVYMLTTSSTSNKTVCLLSDIKSDLKYNHICEYVLDFCFANTQCGKHGRCVNTQLGFKCSCSFLYDGLRCEKISKLGKQFIICLSVVLFLNVLLILKSVVKTWIQRSRNAWKRKQRRENDDDEVISPEMMPMNSTDENFSTGTRIRIKNSNKLNLVRLVWVGGLTVICLTVLLSITSITYVTDLLIMKCGNIPHYRIVYLVFPLVAFALFSIFSWSIKRENRCLRLCNGRPGLLPPVELFQTANRFSTAAVFGILAIQIFEEVVFNPINLSNGSILIELIARIAMILLIGLRYYPVLASLQLRNMIVRLLICLYIIFDIAYTILRETTCMRSTSLSSEYSEAKLQRKLIQRNTIYSFIKNIPHFALLSYICAELCVRFVYDSIYVPLKKKRSIWLEPVEQSDEYTFAKSYVAKLFRRKIHSTYINTDTLDDFENQAKPFRMKRFFDFIYRWDNDFRFTTIAACAYTVAMVFLYYFACTLVFLYISKTNDRTSFIGHLQEFVPLKSTITSSAVIAFVIITHHLLMAMKNYKIHKLELFKGICTDIPPAATFQADVIAARSARYAGFFVGHTACGFILYFHLILFIMSVIRIVSVQIPSIQFLLGITVPALVMYLLLMVIILLVGRFLSSENAPHIKNRKLYAIFVYFSFIIDCVLGIAVCIFRLIKAGILNIVFMTRLDSSLYGRPAERFDLGFNAYVSYLHMEVAQTNPVMLAFCHSIYEDIVQRRPKNFSDDEIAPKRKSKVVKSVSFDVKGNNDDRSTSENSSTIEIAGSEPERLSNIATTDSTVDHLLSPMRTHRANKRARFRWFLLYTIIRNYSILDLRKDIQTRIAYINLMRNNLINNRELLSTPDFYNEPSPQTSASPHPELRFFTLADATAEQPETLDDSVVFKLPANN